MSGTVQKVFGKKSRDNYCSCLANDKSRYPRSLFERVTCDMDAAAAAAALCSVNSS